jgi:glycosyltransferase involved in cell wall biosynthesis
MSRGEFLVKVSVVVSTYSEDKSGYVLDCLGSLKRQSVLPREIILVLDPRPGLLEFYQSRLSGDVKIVVSRDFGLSNARNAGIKYACGEVVAFIDDDAVADVNWIRNLTRGYENQEVVGVGGHITPIWEDGFPAWFPEELNWVVGCSYKGLPEHRASVRNPIGCNMSFRKSIFDEVGYFRTDVGRFGRVLLSGEEPELSLRILKKFPNFKILYEPQAVVYHKVDKSRRKLTYLFRRSFYEGISKALIVLDEATVDHSLSAENQYLKYLFKVAIPSRVKRFYRLDVLSQLVTLFLSTFAVLLGFSVGKLSNSRIDNLH